MGRLDENGYLYIEGRADEMINCGGQKVAPQEIERILQLHPQVRVASVCAVPDSRLGQVPIAFVMGQHAQSPAFVGVAIDSDFDEITTFTVSSTDNGQIDTKDQKELSEELIRFCRDRLALFKIPRRIIWINDLPRTASGKIKRQDLVAWYEEKAQ
jgi:acyl-CoA synthetase (AMP-forming)/AMP-acid ligase II